MHKLINVSGTFCGAESCVFRVFPRPFSFLELQTVEVSFALHKCHPHGFDRISTAM